MPRTRLLKMKTSTPPEMPEHVPNLILRRRPKSAVGDLFPLRDNSATLAGNFSIWNGYVGDGLQKPDAFDQAVGGFEGSVAVR